MSESERGMNILEWLFGKANIIDADWVQTSLRDIPYSDAEHIRDNSFSEMNDRGVPAKGTRCDKYGEPLK